MYFLSNRLFLAHRLHVVLLQVESERVGVGEGATTLAQRVHRPSQEHGLGVAEVGRLELADLGAHLLVQLFG